MTKDIFNFDKGRKTIVTDNLLKSYGIDQNQQTIEKSDESTTGDSLEKGGKRAVIGEKREFSGRMYIKTAQGWKFFGKGTGSKAQDHHNSAASHDSKEDKKTPLKEIEEKITKFNSPENVANLKTNAQRIAHNRALKNLVEQKQNLESTKDEKNLPLSERSVESLKKEISELHSSTNSSNRSKIIPKIRAIEFELNKREENSKKKYTFTEILADSEGKKLIEAIEHGSSDPAIIKDLQQQLKDKFNYDYQVDGEEALKQSKSKSSKSKAEIGEIRSRGGVNYIKTENGWKYHGKGEKKQEASKEIDSQSKKESTLPQIGSNVEVKRDLGLTSYQNMYMKMLKVIGYEDSGLTSVPQFLKVKDSEGTTYSINPQHVNQLTTKPTTPSSTAKVKDYLDPDEARKLAGNPNFEKQSLKDAILGYEKYISAISPANRVIKLNNIQEAVENDKGKVSMYQKYQGRHSSILEAIDKLRKKLIEPKTLKIGKKNIVVDNKGVMAIDGVKVQVNSSSGFVKLGGGGFSSVPGAYYGGDAFRDQLQGITYVSSFNKFRNLVLNGADAKQIEQEMSKHKGPISGEQPGFNWKHFVKPHLGL